MEVLENAFRELHTVLFNSIVYNETEVNRATQRIVDTFNEVEKTIASLSVSEREAWKSTWRRWAQSFQSATVTPIRGGPLWNWLFYMCANSEITKGNVCNVFDILTRYGANNDMITGSGSLRDQNTFITASLYSVPAFSFLDQRHETNWFHAKRCSYKADANGHPCGKPFIPAYILSHIACKSILLAAVNAPHSVWTTITDFNKPYAKQLLTDEEWFCTPGVKPCSEEEHYEAQGFVVMRHIPLSIGNPLLRLFSIADNASDGIDLSARAEWLATHLPASRLNQRASTGHDTRALQSYRNWFTPLMFAITHNRRWGLVNLVQTILARVPAVDLHICAEYEFYDVKAGIFTKTQVTLPQFLCTSADSLEFMVEQHELVRQILNQLRIYPPNYAMLASKHILAILMRLMWPKELISLILGYGELPAIAPDSMSGSVSFQAPTIKDPYEKKLQDFEEQLQDPCEEKLQDPYEEQLHQMLIRLEDDAKKKKEEDEEEDEKNEDEKPGVEPKAGAKRKRKTKSKRKRWTHHKRRG